MVVLEIVGYLRVVDLPLANGREEQRISGGCGLEWHIRADSQNPLRLSAMQSWVRLGGLERRILHRLVVVKQTSTEANVL